jgi:hypothetical protein
MLSYLYFVIPSFAVYWFVKLDCKRIIYNKYKSFRNLNTMVSTTNNNNNTATVLWVSSGMLFEAVYISFLQYMNNSVKKTKKNEFEVTYIIKGRVYKILIVPDRGPAPVLQISDENMEDMTDYILPYLGPNYNWHNIKFTPRFFNSETLTFEFSNGLEKTFEIDEVLVFKTR